MFFAVVTSKIMIANITIMKNIEILQELPKCNTEI